MGPPGFLLLGDEGPEALEGGVVLAAEGLDPRVNVVPGLPVAADLILERGEPGALLLDAGRLNVLAPGEPAELAPESGLLLLFPFQFDLDPEAGHVAAGPRQESADAAAEVLVAEEDEGHEEEDDAEEDPEQPEGEPLRGGRGRLDLKCRVHPAIMA